MLPEDAVNELADLQIVDVREPFEFSAGHIEDSIPIPLNDIPQRYDELDASKRTLVVCQIGQRSDMAARFLRSKGIDAHNLDGGLRRWLDQGLPLASERGPASLEDGYGRILED